MKKYAKIITLLILLSTLTPFPSYADVFKIDVMRGNWSQISDDYIASNRETGEALLRLYADGYRMGSWILSIDLDLEVQEGGEAVGYIKIEIPELDIELTYYERYINGGLFGPDYIGNNLTLSIGDETVLEEMDEASEPFNSRLNTRYYFVLMKVVDKLILEFRDEYGSSGGLNSIYVNREIPYDDREVTLVIEIYKNSFQYEGSVKAPLILNVPKDSISYEKFEYNTLDYSANAIFFLSLAFLLGAISFNLISTKFRILQEEELAKKVKKEKKDKKKKK